MLFKKLFEAQSHFNRSFDLPNPPLYVVPQDGSGSGTCAGGACGGAGARVGDAAQAPLHLLQQDVQAHVLRAASPLYHLTCVVRLKRNPSEICS